MDNLREFLGSAVEQMLDDLFFSAMDEQMSGNYDVAESIVKGILRYVNLAEETGKYYPAQKCWAITAYEDMMSRRNEIQRSEITLSEIWATKNQADDDLFPEHKAIGFFEIHEI